MAFSEKDKIKIIRWYKQNGESLEKTAEKFKVSRKSIQNWLKVAPAETIKHIETSVERIVKQEESAVKSTIIKYQKEAAEVITAANKRILELIPECKSIPILIELNKAFNPIALENEINKKGEDEEGNKPGDQYNVLIHNIIKHHDEAWTQINSNQ